MTHFLPTGSDQEPAADIPPEYAVGVRARVTTPEGWPVAHPVITLTDRSGVQITRTVGEAHGEAAGPPVPAGTYTLIVTAPGYQPAARTVTLPARVIPLQPETMTLTRSGTAALPELGTWTIDPLHSTINLTAHHLGIGGIRGRFTRFSGRIEIAEPFERSGVLTEIDAASIDTGNDVRDDQLRSANFLEVEAYPAITYQGSGLIPRAAQEWTLHGALTVHGVTHPVDLELSYSGVTRDPWGGIRAGFRATTSLRRHDFEIAFDERLLSGIAQIGSTVRIELDMQAVQGPTLPWRDLGLEI